VFFCTAASCSATLIGGIGAGVTDIRLDDGYAYILLNQGKVAQRAIPAGNPSFRGFSGTPSALALSTGAYYVATNGPTGASMVQIFPKDSGAALGSIVTSAGLPADGAPATNIITLAADDTHVVWGTDETGRPLYSCATAACLDGGATMQLTAFPIAPALRALTMFGGSASGIFWAEASSALATATEDLTTPLLFIGTSLPVASVAVDPLKGRFYWIEGPQLKVCGANGLGPCSAANESTFATAADAGSLAEVTVAGGYVFWFDVNAGFLMRANTL
jgi:hypothetical protein